MLVKVKKLNKLAKLPIKKYASDFCYDVYAASKEEIAPNVFKYGLGLAFQMVNDTYDEDLINLCIDFRPRSSVWKTGMILSNCEGTIDYQYTGEVSAIFYKVVENGKPYEVGDRIGQIKIGYTEPIDFIEVEELKETDRGSNGYGSTGLK